jgi:DNA-binding response OmpR family regulator
VIPILLVEGSRIESEGLQRTLGHFGYFVEVADDIEAAAQWMEHEQFALVLLELAFPPSKSMPSGWEGTTFLREMRTRGVTTPLLVYTWLADGWYEEAAREAGADAFIPKKEGLSNLLSRLRTLLRSNGRTSSDRGAEGAGATVAPTYGKVQLGELVLDRERNALLAREDVIPLTWRERKILETLTVGSGRIVSSQELLDGAWRDSLGGSPHALHSAMTRLRKKLETFAVTDFIQNAKGRGYFLSTPARNPLPSTHSMPT